MNYLEIWRENIFSRKSLTLKQSIYVEGIRDQHCGPRWEKARVSFLIEPSNEFDVNFGITQEYYELLQKDHLLDYSIFGLLDELLLGYNYPVMKVKITINNAEYDPCDSTQIAFRKAGRDAGSKVIGLIIKNPNEYLVT